MKLIINRKESVCKAFLLLLAKMSIIFFIMLNKESENKFDINIFEKAEEYEQFIAEKNMGSSYGNGAKATINTKGEVIIAIDKSYYLSGGIKARLSLLNGFPVSLFK